MKLMTRFVKDFRYSYSLFRNKKLRTTWDQTYMPQLNACLDDKESLSENGPDHVSLCRLRLVVKIKRKDPR
jgi:hypothetical protein